MRIRAVLLVSILLFGSLAGVGTVTASDQTNADTPDDNDVVVRFADDHVVSGAAADRMPSDPYVTAGYDGEPLVVAENEKYDFPVVQTKDGTVATAGERPVVRVENETDLVVLDDTGSIDHTLVVDRDDGGLVKTDDKNTTVTVDGIGSVRYEPFDETDVKPEIQNVSDVDEGETLEVGVEFENREWGNNPNMDVDLKLLDSGEIHDEMSKTINISGGEQISETFEYNTTRYDYNADEIKIAVPEDGNTDTTDVTIGAAGAAVTGLETNDPIEGQTLEVTADIDRFGRIPDDDREYPIRLLINGSAVQTEVVTLAPDGSTTETFTYQTGADDVPEAEVTVSSPTDSASVDVPILSRADHDYNIQSEITDTRIGNLTDELEVDASFWYTGEMPGDETQFTANLTVDGTVEDQRSITLDGESRENATFTYTFNPNEPPITNASIVTPGETKPLSFESGSAITFDNVTDPVVRNGSMTATVTVENRGEVPGRETLTIEASNPYAVESDGTYTTSGPLETSESFTETVTFNVTEEAPPRLKLTASTTNATETYTVDVRDDEPRFEIENTTIADATADGTSPAVSAAIRNTGGAAGTQDVTFTFDSKSIATDELTLEPDEVRTISAPVEQSASGTYSYGVTTADDSSSGTTTVEYSASSQTESPGSEGILSLDTLAIPLLAVSLFGVVLGGAAIVKRRTDPDDLQELQERMTALQPAARKLQRAARNARNLVSNSGTGTVIVQNQLPRSALVRVRVRSDEEILFLEDFELDEDEQRTLECLPDADQFEVGTGVDDIAAHEETFRRGTGEVGIVLQPDGITISEL